MDVQIAPHDRVPTANIVLFLDSLSQSLRDRRHKVLVDDQPLLAHFIECLTDAERRACQIVAADTEDCRFAKDVVGPHGCTVICSSGGLQLSILYELIGSKCGDHIAVLQLEYLLAPHGLASTLLYAHARSGADITYVCDLPERVSPLVFTSEATRSLSQLYSSYVARDICLVRALIPTLNQLKAPTAKRLNIHSPKIESFYPTSAVPRSRVVTFVRPLDFAVLKSTLPRVPSPATTPLQRLSTWRSEMIKCREKERKSLKSKCSSRDMWSPPISRTRILYVSNPAAYSGAEESLLQLVTKLPKTEFELHALVSQPGYLTERLQAAGVTVHCPGFDFGSTSIDNILFLKALCDEIDPHVVHLNAISGLPIAAVAELKNIPLILHVRNAFADFYTEYVHAADAIIAVSEYARDLLLELDVPAEKMHVVYDEIDPTYFIKGVIPPVQAREMLGLPTDRKIVTCISRFAPNKQHPLLIEAFAQLLPHVQDAHLLLKGETFGDIEYRTRVQHMIEKRGLKEYVTTVSFVDDIRAIYSVSDVLVLCSRNEAFGRCVGEAMAMEVPVIVTKGGGASEIVENDRTGILVDHDAGALSAALIRILSDGDIRKRCTAGAREIVCEKLDSRKSAEVVADIYRTLVTREKGLQFKVVGVS